METDRHQLHEKIDSLAGTIRDIDLQQRVHNLAITRLEQGRTVLPSVIDQETLTDARHHATEGLLPNLRRQLPGSPAASVVDLRIADREAPAHHRLPLEGNYPSRNSAP